MKTKIVKSLAFVFALAGTAQVVSACDFGAGGLKAIAKEDIKVGFIYIHDPSSSTYDKNFKDAITKAMSEFGLNSNQLFEKTGVSDSDSSAYSAAIDLIDNKGCNIIIANSFGHEVPLIDVAKENPSVRFCHASGVKAHTEKLDNYSNGFAAIYEGRYLAGVAAGMKLNELGGAHKMGYVGAYNYAEVISGFTAFYLGAKSVCSDVTMDVRYTSSWGDEAKEKSAALALIAGGAQIISQHADTYGAPAACKEQDVPNVSYNVAAKEGYSDTYLAYSKIDWTNYYKFVLQCAVDNTLIPHDYVGTLENGGVVCDDLGTIAATGTQAEIDKARNKIVNEKYNIFDLSTFTVSKDKNPYADFTADKDGHIITAKANVDDTDDIYSKETEVCEDGFYKESCFRCSPYFDFIIDGITEVSDK